MAHGAMFPCVPLPSVTFRMVFISRNVMMASKASPLTRDTPGARSVAPSLPLLMPPIVNSNPTPPRRLPSN